MGKFADIFLLFLLHVRSLCIYQPRTFKITNVHVCTSREKSEGGGLSGSKNYFSSPYKACM